MSELVIRSMGLKARDAVVLGETIHRGVSAAAVQRLLDASGWTKSQLFEWAHIPPANGNRRFRAGHFQDHESERIARLARAFDQAQDMLRDRHRAARWMQEANPRLGGRSPVQVCGTEFGAREVEAVIGRLRHGVY
ncbi:MAG: DUF2384 domain-containing protein [Euryarchaeota archaeon]|nr:DUF2384 domain-containing protein [Euryarchaeota archaeon]